MHGRAVQTQWKLRTPEIRGVLSRIVLLLFIHDRKGLC